MGHKGSWLKWLVGLPLTIVVIIPLAWPQPPDSAQPASPVSSATRVPGNLAGLPTSGVSVSRAAPAAGNENAPATGSADGRAPRPALAIRPGDSKDFVCAFVSPRKDPYELTATATSYCPSTGSRKNKTLVPDQGSVVVVLRADDYYAALSAEGGQSPRLYLNGADMGAASRFYGATAFRGEVALTYQIGHADTKEARSFWNGLFEQTGFHGLTPLYVTLGWPTAPDYFRSPVIGGVEDTLLIADLPTLAFAACLGIIVVAGFICAMYGSDIFRIAASQGGQRQAFSFARVQWGVWTTFAIAAAIFLTVVDGTVPGLSTCMLGLVGVSTLSATTSFFLDARGPTQLEATSGLLNDLLSGNGDQTAQAHRYQALMVNVALLAAAFYWLLTHLEYPSFDSTWLAMLGISDAGHLVGKGMLEGPNKPVLQQSNSTIAGPPPPPPAPLATTPPTAPAQAAQTQPVPPP